VRECYLNGKEPLLRPRVVAGGEHRPVAAEDHDADLVVGLRLEERFVELDEQPALLRIALVRSVEHDPGMVPSSRVSYVTKR
jgi:hypothetical protein